MLKKLDQYYVSSSYRKIVQLVQINVVGIETSRQAIIELITFLLNDQKKKIVPHIIHVKLPYSNYNGHVYLSNIDCKKALQNNHQLFPEISEMINENIAEISLEINHFLNLV